MNLERPVRLAIGSVATSCSATSTRVGSITQQRTPARRLDARRLRAHPRLTRYVVEKGSVTVDGMSLTVAAVADDGFGVALIPHTLEVTTLGTAGRRPVNLEADMVAKYMERSDAEQKAEERCRLQQIENAIAAIHAASSWWSSTTPTVRTRATSSWRPRR